jgi:hypothetical protein
MTADANKRLTLFLMEKLMKFVSTSTWYGGPSCVLYLKNMADDTFSLQIQREEQGSTSSLFECTALVSKHRAHACAEVLLPVCCCTLC